MYFSSIEFEIYFRKLGTYMFRTLDDFSAFVQ